MSDFIPPDVLTKILLELPVKSLVRFTVVSKTWQAFITSPEFISIHLSKAQYDHHPTCNNPTARDSLIIRYYSGNLLDDLKEHYELRPNSDDYYSFLTKSSEIKFPAKLKSREGFNQIVGTCNGIICLCDSLSGKFSTSPVVLWNPSIQKDIVLPLPVIEPSTKCFVLGFGYDVQRDDYKVVRIRYRPGFIRKPMEAEIFSLRNKRWRTAKDVIFRGYINDIGQSQVYLNGIVHWMAYQEKGNGDLENSILGFDCSDNEFIETVLPDNLADFQLNPNLHITAHEGCLGMISYNNTSCQIWEMKEYGSAESWSHLYSFEWTQLYEVPLHRGMAKVVGFRKTGELLMTLRVEDDENAKPYCTASGHLVSYDPADNGVTLFPEIHGWLDSFHVLDYVESLCLLDYSRTYQEQGGEVIDKACLGETVYPVKEEEKLVSGDASMEEVYGFGKFKECKKENDDSEGEGEDFCMGEVNLDKEETAAGDDFVTIEEFEFEGNKDVNNGGGDVFMEEVDASNNQSDDDDDIFPMEEVDASWILVLKD